MSASTRETSRRLTQTCSKSCHEIQVDILCALSSFRHEYRHSSRITAGSQVLSAWTAPPPLSCWDFHAKKASGVTPLSVIANCQRRLNATYTRKNPGEDSKSTLKVDKVDNHKLNSGREIWEPGDFCNHSSGSHACLAQGRWYHAHDVRRCSELESEYRIN